MSRKPPNDRADYDPYDPERKAAQRRPRSPRLADLSKPLPPPDPGPAVPRPYAPQKRIRDDQVVPPSDNPLVGWRWTGARLLSRNLWPRDALTNALMVYYSGRKRGRLMEDFMGLAPWIFFLLFDTFLLLGEVVNKAKDFEPVWIYGLISFPVLAIFSFVYSSIVAAFHLRRTLHNMPIEEILLTRLKHVDIVQGLSIRPLAVQSSAIVFNSLVHGLLIVWAGILIGSDMQSPAVLGYIIIMPFLRWYLYSVLSEMGGAIAVRAHLCLRSPLTATLRVFLDFFIAMIPLTIIYGVIFTIITCIASCFGLGLIAGMNPLGYLLFIVFITTIFFCELVRNYSIEAMDFCHHYPEEWWVTNSPEELEAGLAERTLFTSWKPIPGRKRHLLNRMSTRTLKLDNKKEE